MAFFEGIQGFEGEEVDNTPPRPPPPAEPSLPQREGENQTLYVFLKEEKFGLLLFVVS